MKNVEMPSGAFFWTSREEKTHVGEFCLLLRVEGRGRWRRKQEVKGDRQTGRACWDCLTKRE
jgi:hypothetical protein